MEAPFCAVSTFFGGKRTRDYDEHAPGHHPERFELSHSMGGLTAKQWWKKEGCRRSSTQSLRRPDPFQSFRPLLTVERSSLQSKGMDITVFATNPVQFDPSAANSEVQDWNGFFDDLFSF